MLMNTLSITYSSKNINIKINDRRETCETSLRNTFEIPELVTEILDAVGQEAKALLVQEFGADVGQLVFRRDVVDADGAVVFSRVSGEASESFSRGCRRRTTAVRP